MFALVTAERSLKSVCTTALTRNARGSLMNRLQISPSLICQIKPMKLNKSEKICFWNAKKKIREKRGSTFRGDRNAYRKLAATWSSQIRSE